MQKGLFSLLFMILLAHAAAAQKVLALENPYRTERIFFHPGDYLVFRGHDGKAKYEGHIEAIFDSVIVLVKVVKIANEGDATNNVFRDYVPIREIKYVYGESRSYWHFFRKMVAVMGTVSGGYLLATAGFNHYYLDLPVDGTAVLVAGALAGTGLLFNFMGNDHRKIGKRWRLRAMDAW